MTRARTTARVMKGMRNDPDMLAEYDFSKGVRGKYAKRYAAGTNVVVLDPDVAEYFPDHWVRWWLGPLVVTIT